MSLIPVLLPEANDYAKRIDELQQRLRGGSVVAGGVESGLDIPGIVAGILAKVAQGGDRAAAQLTSEFDRAQVTAADLRVPCETIAAARAQADPGWLGLIRSAIANIREYQEHILIKAPPPLVRGGRRLGIRYTPLERVGMYVPGGRALYPSTVLMTAIPALVAGVPQVVMASPPSGGDIHPLALALAAELGIDEVYRLGGAVAIAALTYGTETIKPVHKLVGPGNAFVAEAKRQLFGRVGIDSIAGPSEVLIVGDDTAPPDWIALDLLAQAEHDPGSAVLITPSRELVSKVAGALTRELDGLERCGSIRAALASYGALIVTASLEAACALANDFAPEHLELMTHDDAACLRAIRHAGAIFVGSHTPVSLGDYWAGPSHVLPTGGTARFFGPLSANDFLKASSWLEYDAASVREDAPKVAEFARREGLTAHARSVERRLLAG